MPKATLKKLLRLRKQLLKDAELELNYVVLVISSCAIATMGLLNNSPAVIIGAMIVAPLMQPLRGVAFGALEADLQLFRKSLWTGLVGTGVAIFLSWAIGRFVNLPPSEFSSEMLSRTQPNLVDLGVAIAAGAVSGFAKIRPRISDALAGTAIAVALMPPLCVVGISLSQGFFAASWGAFLLYCTNFLGIILACMLVFVWGGYYIETEKIGRALGWTFALVGAIVIPLFWSFWTLLAEANIRATLKEVLQRETITVGQQVSLLRAIEIDWNQNPPEVQLSVNAKEPITPKQVREVEEFLYDRMQRRFTLVFQESQVREVRGQPPQTEAPETENPGEKMPPQSQGGSSKDISNEKAKRMRPLRATVVEKLQWSTLKDSRVGPGREKKSYRKTEPGAK
ncbi:DUF389 domain-containing protein [Phormidium sp. CCY1219]|uniref:DUF389 domain-containing protein n=1 Tax=Phormidium sp. CCY1219 TaxID=2886104 RepID=UPI002D1EFD47|nr:DUF389 domain-containing protein [Phormidium sp. CCY1219]MEB3828198.1 DUF389 domain-containing protein [Phormidium sp. CCY1219]